METKYDSLVNLLLNNWFVALIVLVAVVLIAIPKIRDGIKTLFFVVQGQKGIC